MAVIPNVDQTRRFSTWHIREIYTGPNGTGVFVPNVDDMVMDWNSGVYRVAAVDHYRTNLSYLVKVNLNTLGGGIDDGDIAVVTGPGANSNSFRVYVNTEVVPHTLAVDARVIWNGAANAYVKIFKGTDTSETTGVVISAMVSTNGNITSENIPLVTVVVPNGTNVTQKTPNTAWSSETLLSGDIVTIVTYTAAGVITSRDKFVIENTNYIRSINQASKYVTNIELITPFLSKTDSRLIECPINMLVQSMNFAAKVTYSDNTSVTANIDGSKWQLAGLKMFVATQIGKTDGLALIYKLGTGELAFDASAALPDRTIIREYRIRTVDIDTYYSVKLFAVPVWNSSSNRYVLNWYLYNLERSDIVDVTAQIEFSTTSPAFVGNQYNSTQNIQVAFNMQKLGANYSYFRHVQNVAITLLAPGSSSSATQFFSIGYGANTLYGGPNVRGLYSTDELNVGKLKLSVACGKVDVATWIQDIYRNLEPLYYSTNEPVAPAPTHAKLIIGTGASAWQREIPMDQILNPVRNINVTINRGTPIRLELFARDQDGDHQLAVAPMVATLLA